MRTNPNLNINDKYFSIILTIIPLLLCLFYTPLYVEGDQYYYNLFYEELAGQSLRDGYDLYLNFIGAREPLYYLFVYLFSHLGIDKLIVMTCVNVCFAYFLILNLIKYKVNKIIILTLIFNYYFYVLLFSAERLKMGLFILLLSFYFNKRVVKLILSLLALLFHFQIILLLFSVLYDFILSSVKKIRSKFKRTIFYLFVFSSIITVLLSVIDLILLKFNKYSQFGGLSNILKPTVFLLLTLIIVKKGRMKVIFQFLPLIVGSVLVGSDRLVIFCYFLFLLYALRINKGLNLPVIVTSIYFIFMGYEFLDNIFNYGTGFYNK